MEVQSIIKGRPYQREEDLIQRKIIPLIVYRQITHKIVTKQKEGRSDTGKGY